MKEFVMLYCYIIYTLCTMLSFLKKRLMIIHNED